MKKFLSIVAIATAAVACTKSAVTYDDDVEIDFTPVNGQVSKAGVYGPLNETGTTYSTSETFGVFAYHKTTAAAQQWAAFQSDAASAMATYIDKGEFEYRASTTNDFGGKTPYYWPKTGYLAFAGYSPYTITTENNATVAYDPSATPKLTATGFTQGEYVWAANADAVTNKTVDFMWFDVNDDNRETANTGKVAVIFKHACSWIDVKLTGALDSQNASAFKVYKVSLTNVYRKGDFTSDTETWNNFDTSETIVLYDNSTGQSLNATAFAMTNLMTIPQTIAAGTETKLVIEYKQITSGEDNALLETLEFDIDGESNPTAWELGKHYTYSVSFTLNEIILNPTAVEWITVTDIALNN